jgi:hypothetical protein
MGEITLLAESKMGIQSLRTRKQFKKILSSFTEIYTKTSILDIQRWMDFLLICYTESIPRPLYEERYLTEKVLQVLNSMNGDKAPGSDGFTIAFFQKYYSVVRGDIMNFFHYFHARSTFEKNFHCYFYCSYSQENWCF